MGLGGPLGRARAMSKRRDLRRAKALAYLRQHQQASALDLGLAAVDGEPGAKFIPWRHKERIGLTLVSKLVRAGKAIPTSRNHFCYAGKGTRRDTQGPTRHRAL